MKTVIYRSGSMAVGTHNEDVLMDWVVFDESRPNGHASRSTSLFASPDFLGGQHWMNRRLPLALVMTEECGFHEITVESDNVRVYNIEDYDAVGHHYGNPTAEQQRFIDAYWNTSMTLTEWMVKVGEDEYGQWEVLLPVTEVISSRLLSEEEISELSAEYELW